MTAPGTDVGLLNEISAAITNVAVPIMNRPRCCAGGSWWLSSS